MINWIIEHILMPIAARVVPPDLVRKYASRQLELAGIAAAARDRVYRESLETWFLEHFNKVLPYPVRVIKVEFTYEIKYQPNYLMRVLAVKDYGKINVRRMDKYDMEVNLRGEEGKYAVTVVDEWMLRCDLSYRRQVLKDYANQIYTAFYPSAKYPVG